MKYLIKTDETRIDLTNPTNSSVC